MTSADSMLYAARTCSYLNTHLRMRAVDPLAVKLLQCFQSQELKPTNLHVLARTSHSLNTATRK